MALIVIAVFVLALLIGLPMFIVLGLTCLAYFLLNDISPLMIVQRMFVGLDGFVTMAVPLFILAGNLMNTGGTLDRLVKFANVVVGHVRGGLAQVNVLGSMFFAGISGAATADVAALGPLEVKAMTDSGYEKDFATALTVASATLGPLIPPSLHMVIYGVTVSQSIGALFMAGVVPGILLGLAMMVQVDYFAKKYNFPKGSRPSLKLLAKEFIRAIGPLGLPAIIVLGIFTGFFTPTEAAAMACLYAFIIGKFVYKELTWRNLPKVFLDTGIICAGSMLIVAISNCFSWVIAIENIPQIVTEFLLSITSNKYILLLLINIGLLILGCFMEGVSAIIITAPILVPAVMALGVDPIHFGLIMNLNITLGLLTPPMGLSLFIASSFTKLPVTRIARKTMPFFLMMVGLLLIITFVPEITMFLPNLLTK